MGQVSVNISTSDAGKASDVRQLAMESSSLLAVRWSDFNWLPNSLRVMSRWGQGDTQGKVNAPMKLATS